MITNAAKRGILSVLLTFMMAFAVHAEEEVPFVQGEGPPNAKPGEAWCLVRKPACYKTVSEQVCVSPATTYLEYIPAKWETKDEQICVAPETKRATVVPCTWKTEQFTQVVKPEHTELEVVPAQYECGEETICTRPECEDVSVGKQGGLKCVTEQVQVAPAYAYWKETPGQARGDIKCYCRCEVPAKFVCVTKWVPDGECVVDKCKKPAQTKTIKVWKLVKDAEVRKKVVPAEVVTMCREVIATPAEVKYENIPAKFETIHKQVQVAPETSKKVEVPAKFETVNKQVLEAPEHLVWVKRSCGNCGGCKDVVSKYKEVPGTDERSLRMLINK
jgi:hypothetical protein